LSQLCHAEVPEKTKKRGGILRTQLGKTVLLREENEHNLRGRRKRGGKNQGIYRQDPTKKKKKTKHDLLIKQSGRGERLPVFQTTAGEGGKIDQMGQ